MNEWETLRWNAVLWMRFEEWKKNWGENGKYYANEELENVEGTKTKKNEGRRSELLCIEIR